jgi:hypothetical protein
MNQKTRLAMLVSRGFCLDILGIGQELFQITYQATIACRLRACPWLKKPPRRPKLNNGLTTLIFFGNIFSLSACF